MKLWDVYKQVKGNTSKLKELYDDRKIDTAIYDIKLFTRLLKMKSANKLLFAYHHYYKRSCRNYPYNYDSVSVDKEITEYISTLTVNQLLQVCMEDICTEEVEKILVPKSFDLIDLVKNKKIKAKLISYAMFSGKVDHDVLTLKRKGIIPPVGVSPLYGIEDPYESALEWYLDWIRSEAPSSSHVNYIHGLEKSVDSILLIKIVIKYFSAKTILIAFSLYRRDKNVYEELVSVVFDKLSMQEFLETIYETDEEYSDIDAYKLQELYFRFRDYADI